jgi:hypothetical protein
MTKHGASLLLDATMLLSFTVLMSWRLAGVPAHEWLAAGLLGLIVVHLVIHWGWVETRARKAVGTRSPRTRMNLLLNGHLFLAMGTANTLTPGAYLSWHQVHDTSSSLAQIILGLHVALNWDLIVAGIRRAARGEASVSSFVPVGRRAAVARAGAPFVMRLLLLSAVVVGGRRALKLRLE